jgi:hypothetical protein
MAAFTAITQQPPRVAAFARRAPTDANGFNTRLIYQIAKNCRTSVEMIEKNYAAHMKNNFDTSTINRHRSGFAAYADQPNMAEQDIFIGCLLPELVECGSGLASQTSGKADTRSCG